ncbi:MAG: alpha/beta hydrolase [Dehalococcoidia bacterium]
MVRAIPLYTLEGVTGAEKSYHYFSTGDGLGLSLQRFNRAPSDDIVLIVHGLTTSTDMFVMPEHYNLVQYLLDHGFSDVFTVDYRMSNRWIYNLERHRYTMDDIALYDFPAALQKLREVAGDRRVHVICHCLGSVSFLMSMAAGQVDGISSVIANSAGLTPKVPAFSRFKGTLGPTLFEHVLGLPYVSPAWSDDPGFHRGKLISKLVSLFHRECDVPACHMLSLMWGSGWPALYLHENLDEVTHRRGGDLYGPVNVHYHRHVMRMLKAGNRAVKFDRDAPQHASLPKDYVRAARDLTTPILFVSGDTNRVFSDSNRHCHNVLERSSPGLHSYHEFPGYGHQDVFMGKDVAKDIFPTFVDWMNDHRHPAPV